jgi:hypothetical protein
MGVNGQAKLFETFSCSQQRDHHASLAANRSYVHDLNIAHHTSKSPFPRCSNDVFAALDNRCQASRRALASSPRAGDVGPQHCRILQVSVIPVGMTLMTEQT